MNVRAKNTRVQTDFATRCRRLLRLAILVAVVGFFLFTLRDGHGWGDDFAQYIHHAKNISMCKPYGDTGYVYNPANPVVGPLAYPPVFPLSLSLTYRVFGLNLSAFKIQLILVFAASLLVTAKLFSRSLTETPIVVYLIVMDLSRWSRTKPPRSAGLRHSRWPPRLGAHPR